jgi:RNA polymerase sporulation-specific sigma factor
MENEELAVRIQAGETALISALWEQTERLIKLIAYKFYSGNKDRCTAVGVEADDLYQQGYFALLKAVKAYDASKDFKLTAYFSFHLKNAFREITKMRSTGWEKKQEPISLDAIRYENAEGNGVTLLDSLVDISAEADLDSIIESDYTQQLHADLVAAMSELPDIQRKIIELIYFDNVDTDEAAKAIDKNPNYVRTIQQRALERLSRHKRLQAYRANIINKHEYKGGFRKWKESGSSPQERIILELEHHGLL